MAGKHYSIGGKNLNFFPQKEFKKMEMENLDKGKICVKHVLCARKNGSIN